MIEGLKRRQQHEIESYYAKLEAELHSKMRYSKYVLELRAREKQLVKLHKYEDAEDVRLKAEALEHQERAKRELEIKDIIDVKLNTMARQQDAALSAAFKKIEKDKNQQIKERN
jgi:hypothetical protein